jgi:hypothetical protein
LGEWFLGRTGLSFAVGDVTAKAIDQPLKEIQLASSGGPAK